MILWVLITAINLCGQGAKYKVDYRLLTLCGNLNRIERRSFSKPPHVLEARHRIKLTETI